MLESPHRTNFRFSRFDNSEEERENFTKFISNVPLGISIDHFNCWLDLRELLVDVECSKLTKKEMTSECVANFYKKYWGNEEKKLHIFMTKMHQGEIERTISKVQSKKKTFSNCK